MRPAATPCARAAKCRRDCEVSSGVCASGCAYALIGASTRLIGPGAKFGVHANRVIARADHVDDVRRAGPGARHSAESQSYDLLRHYVTVAGVDPELIDLAVRTPHNRVHWLSREELERFGLVPDDFFETRWFRHAKPDGSTFIIKSLTQVLSTQEHRTTNIAINCVPNTRATVMLRRELGAAENAPQPVVRLSSGEAFVLVFSHGNRSAGATEVRVQPVASRCAGAGRGLRRHRVPGGRRARIQAFDQGIVGSAWRRADALRRRA